MELLARVLGAAQSPIFENLWAWKEGHEIQQKEGHLGGLQGHFGRTETKCENFGMGFEKKDGHFGVLRKFWGAQKVRRVFLKGTEVLGGAKDG